MAKTKRRKRQPVQKKSNTLPFVIAGAVVVVLIGALIIYNQSASKPVATDIVVDYPTGVTADGEPFKGGADAQVVIEDFSDFRCSHCATFADTVHSISDEYIKTGNVKLIFRNYAFLGQGSTNAAQAGECALQQSAEAFWAYHDALFANQGKGENVFTRAGLKDVAEQIGLDGDAFSSCLNSNQMAAEVQADLIDGNAKGVESTPTLFINGQIVRGAPTPADLKSTLDTLLGQ
ncbi:MAG: DsbA family protein [Anaerolineae bacterium]